MKMQRMAIVSFQDPRRISGGIQRRVAEEIAYFVKRGINVTVITEGTEDPVIEGSVTYIAVPTPNVIYPIRSLCFAARVAGCLRKFWKFDVIELHDDASAVLLFARQFGEMPNSILVSVAHGVFRDEFVAIYRSEGLSRSTLVASGYLLLSLIEQMAVHRVNAVVAVSQYIAEQFARQYGVPRERIHVASNGVDTKVFTPPTDPVHQSLVRADRDPCTILYAGRLHVRKGVLQLLQAFDSVRRANPALRLRIVGSGPHEAALHLESNRLRLSDHVEFMGLLSGTELVEAYRSADIVCIPSLQEGQGIVALEAQACGKPVIVTCTGGLAEVVKDQLTGLLVPPGDVRALAEAVFELSGNPTLRQMLGRNGVEWARSFTWENVLSRCTAFYEELLNNLPAT